MRVGKSHRIIMPAFSPSCVLCNLGAKISGRRSNGIKIYDETPKYLIIDDLPEHKWPDTKISILGFLKNHTLRPSPNDEYELWKAMEFVARREGFKQFQIIKTMSHCPTHHHLHLIYLYEYD